MLFSLIVSLYTSRIVLNVLGVSDYGIYNLVGGLVASFTFLTTTLSGASSRFITYELGLRNHDNLHKTFSTIFNIHLILAIIIVVIAEIVGVWMIYNKLVIPEERITASLFVFHCTIFQTFISITQVPYTATIIGHERMNIYAYISIFDVISKLIIVLALQYYSYDKLMLYGGLVMMLSVIVAMTYRLYCIKQFKETHYNFVFDKNLFKKIITFSFWDLYGNMCVVANLQGRILLLNMFWGTITNAAAGITNQVVGVVRGFVTNFQLAARPQIVKRYAEDNHQSMLSLCYKTSKYSFALLLLLSMPIIIETHFVIKLWLGVVPQYVVDFIRLSTINNIIWATFQPFNIGINAVGRMKLVSFGTGSLYLLSIILLYIFLSWGAKPQVGYIIPIFISIMAGIANLYILRRYIPSLSISVFFNKVIIGAVLVSSISFLFSIIIYYSMSEGWIRLLVSCVQSTFVIGLASYYLILEKDMKEKIVSLIINKSKSIYKSMYLFSNEK